LLIVISFVLNTLKILKKKGVWIEITNLVVPTLNDNLGLFHCFGCNVSGNIIKFYAMLKKLKGGMIEYDKQEIR